MSDIKKNLNLLFLRKKIKPHTHTHTPHHTHPTRIIQKTGIPWNVVLYTQDISAFKKKKWEENHFTRDLDGIKSIQGECQSQSMP